MEFQDGRPIMIKPTIKDIADICGVSVSTCLLYTSDAADDSTEV